MSDFMFDAKEFDDYLNALLDAQDAAPARLVEAMRYSLLAGGKRLRPTLVLACFDACFVREPANGREPALRSAHATAAALEMIHTFSLVHDDLPAMDDDDLRRGRPTNHIVYGEALAILAGDALVTLAFETVTRDAAADLVAPLIRELARATGAAGMIGGQVLDMAGENERLSLEALQQVHALKTGALLVAACRCGGIAARTTADQLDSLTRYGSHLGLAFQIVDDMLDVTSTAQQLGKATNKDADRGKNTYPALLGLDGARAEAVRQADLAVAAVEEFGDRARTLRDLARKVVDRDR